ncbi:RICIN domain-containing protein [Streptomyces sp. NPDC091040]|uniref:RICIN domain-containing protein n=1 Tax=Streptomyces sp. NPDC091040 TaxID=3365972 RepID=UPI0037FBB482
MVLQRGGRAGLAAGERRAGLLPPRREVLRECLDVSQGSRTAGANVQQWTCNGQQPQLWRLERV